MTYSWLTTTRGGRTLLVYAPTREEAMRRLLMSDFLFEELGPLNRTELEPATLVLDQRNAPGA